MNVSRSSACVPGQCEYGVSWSSAGNVAHSRIPDFKLDLRRCSGNVNTQTVQFFLISMECLFFVFFLNRISESYLLSTTRTTELSSKTKAEYSSCVFTLEDTPTLCESSNRNLLWKW